MKKCGIYLIKSKIDNKVYVGQSKNISSRLSDHYRRLKANKHSNRHLQFAYNKYGKKNFTHSIICLCEHSYLNENESKFIHQYQSHLDEYGYNLKIEYPTFSKHSQNTIEYMRSIKPCKPVYGFDTNGNYIKKWDSISLCAVELNVSPCDIRRVISQKQRHCRGYVLNSENAFRFRKSQRGAHLCTKELNALPKIKSSYPIL